MKGINDEIELTDACCTLEPKYYCHYTPQELGYTYLAV